jgi:transketolase
MIEITFIPRSEIDRIRQAGFGDRRTFLLLGDMCRLNTLSAVKKAGSGHLGSSFSAMDINVFLYFREMNTVALGVGHPDRDVYFSSKGHDCPGQYAVLFAAGLLGFERLSMLRRLGGLDGHPDVGIPGIEANSGSLGMGISKAKGMALGKKLGGRGGRVFVMTGDGELQEGQIWESLQTTVQQGVHNLVAIVDHNKIQTDKPVRETVDLGDLGGKFEAFGWHVARCDGHDFAALEAAFSGLRGVEGKPKVLIADTVKGRGISFMEGPEALRRGDGTYHWHSGAPDDNEYEEGAAEILDRLNGTLRQLGAAPLTLECAERKHRGEAKMKDTAEKVVNAFGEALVELGKRRKDLVVLDADLSADCGLRPFERMFPGRFLECGIAEQDMVSTAGGLALQGYLPVVNSFGVFLASRANEQIYNNATENTKIVYVCHFSGLIPAGPGKSHQSLRDISLLGAIPNCVILEPCNSEETRAALEWCVEKAPETCMIRLAISPSPRVISLPAGYTLEYGKGAVLREGTDAILFSYGPVMLNEALCAAEILEKDGFSLRVVNMPWLNRVDGGWLGKVVDGVGWIFTLDNHSTYGGLGTLLLKELHASNVSRSWKMKCFGVDEYPSCGTPGEVLGRHGIDGESLAKHILNASCGNKTGR